MGQHALRGPFICRSCGSTYHTRRPKGQGEKYCSRECAFAQWGTTHGKRRHNPDNKASIRAAYNRHLRMRRKNGYPQPARIFDKAYWWEKRIKGRVLSCVFCGVRWSPLAEWGRSRTCSSDCRADNHRWHRRRGSRGSGISKARRTQIYMRDGWHCRCCGQETPKSLMSSNDKCAPECDHVVAQASGGTNEMGNLQCLCRRCNYVKGAKDDVMFKVLFRFCLRHALKPA